MSSAVNRLDQIDSFSLSESATLDPKSSRPPRAFVVVMFRVSHCSRRGIGLCRGIFLSVRRFGLPHSESALVTVCAIGRG